MSFFQELLHVLWCGPSGTGFKKSTSFHQWYNGEHPGTGPEFKDGEEVGEVVPEHITGGRNGVLSSSNALKTETHGFHRSEDSQVEPLSVFLFQAVVDFFNEAGVVLPLWVEPEHCGGTGFTGPFYCQFDPVLDWSISDLAHPEDISLFNVLFQH